MYCVYKHTCPNGKVYIGITCQKPEQRWKHGKGYKNNILFYRAINKYKWENIRHEILCENLNKGEAEKKEIEFIKFFKSMNAKYGYNLCEGGNSSCGYHHTQEAREKMSLAKKGKKQSEIAKQKNSIKHKKCNLSEETYRKMCEANIKINEKRSVEIICVETGIRYKSIHEAERKLKLNNPNIVAVLKGRRKNTKGYSFKYL